MTGAGGSTSVGEWGWAGAASTTCFVAPEQDLVVVTRTQRIPLWTGLDLAIRPIVYGAVLEPEAAGTDDAR